MSEYQYYEFVAVDRSLTGQEMEQLRQLSSRAQITPTSFTNTYHWGSFGGDPRKMVERYFDAHLYEANWGTRELVLRLPAELLDEDTAHLYTADETSTSWAYGSHVLLEYISQEECCDRAEESESRLPSIVSARSDLAAGDTRLLYLGWLLAAQSGALEDDDYEPPVPAGLGELTGPLQCFAEFLRLDEDLIAVAARRSAHRSADGPSTRVLRSWLQELPPEDKDDALLRLLNGEHTTVIAELRRRFHTETGNGTGDSDDPEPRTVGELLYAAGTLHLHDGDDED
jgi:hypothetical protein